MPLRTAIEIGGVRVGLRTDDEAFLQMLHDRYAGFVPQGDGHPAAEFDVAITETPVDEDPDAALHVYRDAGLWRLDRGDFRAHWDPRTARGAVRQTCNPYSFDSLLRILHTLVLAPQGGMLVHSASAVRNGRAMLFAGVSGAGKTTISRVAPPDVTLLTDEISYVRRDGNTAGYVAHGTPFAGELARPGENTCAPLGAIYLLAQGPGNRIEPVAPAQAARELLRHVLFFAEDAALVQAVFHGILALVERVPVHRLVFLPDERVWELIG